MSFKNFYAKNYPRYRQLYPFLKQSQLKIKIKQAWERNILKNSMSVLSSHIDDVPDGRKSGSEDTQKVHK